ncbi:hypothetical protein GDO81_001867 [Engystomops pustulosus]|uniref:Immunoglobulin C1-set domain-containing protein n=1 Tax=Engystomops pustulosus TaxID=76066 RepID=A0AAV7DG56_ENGPU|nr:hypothetical protein GDO81_001867 [Engystomops pustulosus]
MELIALPSEKPTTVPQVFELTSEGDVSSIACLAKDFYPKDIEISVKNNNNIKQDNVTTALSMEGLYTAVSVQNKISDGAFCEVKQDQMIIESKDIKKSSEERQDNQCEQLDSPGVQSIEQIHTFSLTVMGMRALFIKTLIFNLLLSAKIFIM